MKSIFAVAAAAVTLTFAAAAPAMAATYTAAAEFDGSAHGSTGVWSYGYESGSVFHDLTYFSGPNFYGRAGTNFNTPLIGVPDAGTLLMHPGEFGEYAVLRFTASSAGFYSALFSAVLADNSNPNAGPDGVRAILQDQSVNLDRPSISTPSILNWSGDLAAGQTIDFKLDPRGNYGWDSTRVTASVTSGAVPEPAAWALMITGFGLTGAVVRRRRATLSPGSI